MTFGTPDKQYVSLDGSSFIVSNCVFPSGTTAFELAHGTGGIKQGGHGYFLHNLFGVTQGYSDVVDFTGGNRPAPLVHFIGNVFMGTSDDILDLDGTDGWVEGNIFLHSHKNGSPDSSSAVSGGSDSGNTSEVTIINNLFFDCDQAATGKEGNYFALINNTIVHQSHAGGLDTDGGVVNLADEGTTEGLGMYLEGNIIFDIEKLLRNGNAATVIFTNNILPVAWNGPGANNLVADPLLKHIPTAAEAQFNSWQEAQIMWDWFSLLPASPARRTGPNGLDKGAAIAMGASIGGVPKGTNNLSSATLTVGPNRKGGTIPASGWPAGVGYTAYKWRLDGGAWSAETPIDSPISLLRLPNGPHYVDVVGKRDTGVYQDDPDFGPEAVISRTPTWYVDAAYIPPAQPGPLLFNEILARNLASFTSGERTPDLIELYNNSDAPMALDGIGVSDDPALPHKFSFAAGTTLLPRSYIVLLGDSDFTLPGIHAGFALKQEGDSLYLFDTAARGSVLLDSIRFGAQATDFSIGRVGASQWALTIPTFGQANLAAAVGNPRDLRVNEWLASAEFLFGNDFIELYNPDSRPVSLEGLYLSDAPGTPERFAFPALSFVGPRDVLSYKADGDENHAGHVNFKLSRDAGLIMLSAADLEAIDIVSYGPQQSDISQGRSPNGSDTIVFFKQPSPGALNPESNSENVNLTKIITPIFTYTNIWRYNADAIDLGTQWRTTNFNDSAWKSGPGLLGLEASSPYPYPLPISTALSLSNGPTRIKTYYFRTHFNIANTNVTLVTTNFLDDGAVYYLNGYRVGSIRLSADPALYTSDAVNQPSEGQAETLIIPGGHLVEGQNLLAVEVHQSGSSSTDVVFGMAINAVETITNTVVIEKAPFRLNELFVINRSLATKSGNVSSWIELFNPSTNSFNLAGLSLTDDSTNPRKWIFPAGSQIATKGFFTVESDSARPPSSINTGFQLGSKGGAVYLINRPEDGGDLIDAISYGLQIPDFSIGRFPNGSEEWVLTIPTEAASNTPASLGSPNGLRVNEWMADPIAEGDWFEVYNSDSLPVSFAGLAFTDDFNSPTKSPVRPLSFIGGGRDGFAQFLADRQLSGGAHHVDFKLSKSGSDLGISTMTGDFLDAIHFGAQLYGVSQGRLPDGAGAIAFFPNTATPAAPNSIAPKDTDGDGLPDAWETAHGLNPNDPRDASLDSDGDGLANSDEYLAGTDPQNASSTFEAVVLVTNGSVRVSFGGVAGKKYVVQFKNSLSDSIWQSLQIAQPQQDGLITISEPVSLGSRFYRIVIGQ